MKLIKLIKLYQADIILAIAVVLISITAFNLGKISAFKQQKTPITITEPQIANKPETGGYSKPGVPKSSLATRIQKLETNPVVASKKSTGKVYHFSWCPGASKISDKNKITFANEAAAITAGYTLAGNCQK